MQYTRVVLKPQVPWSDVLVTGNLKNSKIWKAVDYTFLKQDEPYLKR
jgi:hypothetical protein